METLGTAEEIEEKEITEEGHGKGIDSASCLNGIQLFHDYV